MEENKKGFRESVFVFYPIKKLIVLWSCQMRVWENNSNYVHHQLILPWIPFGTFLYHLLLYSSGYAWIILKPCYGEMNIAVSQSRRSLFQLNFFFLLKVFRGLMLWMNELFVIVAMRLEHLAYFGMFLSWSILI